MSKVVKGIGRAIKKVVKGVVKIVKKIVKSKIFKIVAAAVLIYFGIPAVSGFLGGAAGAGASGLAGAMNGVAGAWSGLSAAGSAALAGNFSQAGSALASGFTGTTASQVAGYAGAQAASSAATAAAGSAATTAGTTAATTGATTAAGSAAGTAATGAAGSAAGTAATGAAASGQGMIGSLLSSPVVDTALKVAGPVISSIGQGKAAEAQQKEAERLKQEEIDKANYNIGTRLWSTTGTDQSGSQVGTAPDRLQVATPAPAAEQQQTPAYMQWRRQTGG